VALDRTGIFGKALADGSRHSPACSPIGQRPLKPFLMRSCLDSEREAVSSAPNSACIGH
jgi:hypothetical protein